MKVKVDGYVRECDSAKRTKTAVIITRNLADGRVATSSYSGMNIVEKAEVIEGAWEYDAYENTCTTDDLLNALLGVTE